MALSYSSLIERSDVDNRLTIRALLAPVEHPGRWSTDTDTGCGRNGPRMLAQHFQAGQL
jgi:hypothetical protein